MEEKIAQLCKILGAHAVRLIYTPDDHPAWKPWQVIAHYNDDRFQHFKICKTAEEAVNTAIEQAQNKPPALLNIPANWERWPKGMWDNPSPVSHSHTEE